MKVDPTHTKMLRLQYMRQLTKLFKVFRRHAIKDVLLLIDLYKTKYSLDEGYKLRRKTLRQLGVNSRIESYLRWATENYIIDPSVDISWDNIKKSYVKGVNDTSRVLKGHPQFSIDNNITPSDWEAMMELRDINTNLIKGSTDAMIHNIQYSTTQGILNGWGMEKIAREMTKAVDGNNNMGIVRARMIARTEVINAYNVAAKKRYEKAGLSEKEMVWITTYDERTCEICAGYDGMSVDKTGEIPPAHPNCRCSIAPNPRLK